MAIGKLSLIIQVKMLNFDAPITLIIVALTVIVSIQGFSNSILFEKLLFNPYAVKHKKQYYRLLSHTLIHSDWVHLGFNMYTFYSFGTFMEQVFTNPLMYTRSYLKGDFWGVEMGMFMFIALYVLGGLLATLPAMRKHADNYGYNAVGASGAVSAVIMAFMIMFPTLEIRMFFAIPMPAYVGVLIFFGMEHYLQRKGRTNIAHDAHIYGAFLGILFVFLLDPQIVVRFIQAVRMSIFG